MRVRAAIVALIAAVVAGGCAGDPAPRATSRPANPAVAPAGAGERPQVRTATAAAGDATVASAPVEAAGSGLARDEAPPQRRFRYIPPARGSDAPARMIEEPNALALPGDPKAEPKIPELPPVERPPERDVPPPVIPIPPPK